MGRIFRWMANDQMAEFLANQRVVSRLLKRSETLTFSRMTSARNMPESPTSESPQSAEAMVTTVQCFTTTRTQRSQLGPSKTLSENPRSHHRPLNPNFPIHSLTSRTLADQLVDRSQV